MKPITLEQLKELSPTPENPVELVNHGGDLIKVVLLHRNRLCYVSIECDEMWTMNLSGLYNYSQKPKEREKEWLYRNIGDSTFVEAILVYSDNLERVDDEQ